MLWLFRCIYVTVHFCMSLTTLCDVVNAAVNDDRYVCLCELLLAQCVSSTSRRCLDGTTPSSKIQLPLSLYVQGPKNRERETEGNSYKEIITDSEKRLKRARAQGKHVKKNLYNRDYIKKNTHYYTTLNICCFKNVGIVEQRETSSLKHHHCYKQSAIILPSYLPFSTSTSTSLSCWIAVKRKYAESILFLTAILSKQTKVHNNLVVQITVFQHHQPECYSAFVCVCVQYVFVSHAQSSLSLRRWISSPWLCSR